jgi:hypothetical protein
MTASLDEMSEAMSTISEAILEKGQCPTLWKESRGLLIFKKGDPKEISNWQHLTATSSMYRVWSGLAPSQNQCSN